MWVWFCEGSERLPVSVAHCIEMAGKETVLSSMTLWETHLLLEKGRLTSSLSPTETVRLWLEEFPMRIVPVDWSIAVQSRTLEFSHEDPADRFIAATAFHLKLPLATADQRLSRLSWLATIA